ncbi:hypothetical protein MF271_05045 [Deinococcus sp. KNUC1210]|uniref:hypothetical protein n=1 Tax=Deinococcus sp. KNUC1210 TaxID=2917691 RepID=UPI001EF1008E|nr:hypothetical protein [Deinococcus sp. KNUC1210]ULH16002.1 hypothetical protein MF271_05045 [Deinococcus sp. KNUC1210]
MTTRQQTIRNTVLISVLVLLMAVQLNTHVLSHHQFQWVVLVSCSVMFLVSAFVAWRSGSRAGWQTRRNTFLYTGLALLFQLLNMFN